MEMQEPGHALLVRMEVLLLLKHQQPPLPLLIVPAPPTPMPPTESVLLADAPLVPTGVPQVLALSLLLLALALLASIAAPRIA